jgi:hypothetical protein
MAKPSDPGAVRPERLAAYDRLIRTVPGVQRKGASIPYTSVNGNMSSFLFDGTSLALRLPAADREAFMSQFTTRLHQAYGIVQKEYVDVPDALLEDTSQLAPWFAASYAYVSSLKPKPTKRPTARGASNPKIDP